MPSSPTCFAVPSAPDAGDLVHLLSDRLGATVEAGRIETRVVLDSDDSRLRESGVVLELVRAVDGPASLVVRRWGRAATELAIPVEHRPATTAELPARLQAQLTDVPDGAALRAIGEVEVAVHPLAVRDDEQKAVLRAYVDVTASGTWVRLLHVRGYPKAAARATSAIAKLGLRPDAELVEHVYAAAPPPPEPVPAAAAWISVLREQLDEITSHLPGAIAGDDPEELHDLRVAVRRSRSALRHAKGVLPAELVDCFRPELTQLQQATGAARDLDVLRADISAIGDADLEPLSSLLASRAEATRDELVAVLESDTTRALLDDWGHTLDALVAALDEKEADEWGKWPGHANRDVVDVVTARIDRQRKRVLKLGRAIDETSPPERLHELRKQGKELRYLLELFGSHVPDRATPRVTKALRRLQDTLGQFQDLTVQRDELARHRDALPAEAQSAVDRLVDRMAAQQDDERRDFPKRFERFAETVS
jgi:CHAD domain-containing protein